MLISIYFQKKFPVQDEISCTGRNFIQWWFFYRKKNLHMKKFALLIEIFFPGRNLLSREKIIYQNCMAKTSLFNWKSRKLIYPMGKTVWTEEGSRNLSFHIKIHKEDSIYLMSNYHYFSGFLSHLTPAVSGEIFAWKHRLPRSKMFYPTLLLGISRVSSKKSKRTSLVLEWSQWCCS